MKQRIWIFIFSIILCEILTGCIKKDERGKKQKGCICLSVEEV